MWNHLPDAIAQRIVHRRLTVAIALGAVGGATAMGALLGVVTPLLAVLAGVAVMTSLALLWTARDRARDTSPGVSASEKLESRLGFTGKLHVTKSTIVVERFASSTAFRVEELIWAYPVQNSPGRPLGVLRAALVFKLRGRSDIVIPCHRRQITPALSAIRHFAGHAALGWSEELAESWAADPGSFVAEVQARLGRVSGGGEA
jgi:hypothetical protein